MTERSHTNHEDSEFSLVLGGPFFRLWKRSRLAGTALELLHRRIAALIAFAWLPLLVLSVAEGAAWGSGVRLSFLQDVEMHSKLLLALPLLVGAELFVHQRMRHVMQQFSMRDLIPEDQLGKFSAAVASAMRLRNSRFAEILLIVIVYFVGVGLLWRARTVLGDLTWYGAIFNGKFSPSLAGWWLGLVSLPLFQFLLLRWYYRLFIWARLLWKISRIDLRFMPAHPDRNGGIGFLSGVSQSFSPLLLAQGVLLSGAMANQILYFGAKLPEFKLELVGLVAVMIFAILGPLLSFGPKLAAAKRAALNEYGILAQRYVMAFDRKWIRGEAPADEPLMGSADVQSLADLGNSYSVVREMRWVPFTVQTILQLAVTTLLPVAPLLLTVIPLEELIERLIKVIF